MKKTDSDKQYLSWYIVPDCCLFVIPWDSVSLVLSQSLDLLEIEVFAKRFC